MTCGKLIFKRIRREIERDTPRPGFSQEGEYTWYRRLYLRRERRGIHAQPFNPLPTV